MKFMDLNKELKNKIENLYNIVGEDLFLIKQAIANIKSATIKELEEFNYIKLDSSKMKQDEALANISTLPIGNEYRMVVFENPSADVVKLLNKYDFTNDNTVVVCVNAEKLTNATTIECTQLDKSNITKYILHYLSKFNLSIQAQALDYLIDACNLNMSNIVNELNKLSSYALNEDIITMDIATNLISNSSEYAIYMLTNAIDNNDYTTYQRIINDMSKSQSMYDIFSYLGKYFKRMQYVSLNKNDEELSRILNIRPYAVKMSRQQVQKNGIKFYINLYQKYIDLDYKIKSGKIHAENALYELIF